MIEVHIIRGSQLVPKIVSVQVKGHANYDKSGKDLVCAAVSAITIGTMNAIEVLTSTNLDPKVDEGFLFVTLNHIHPASDIILNNIHYSLESMIVMLETIQEAYPAYVSIRTSFSKGG